MIGIYYFLILLLLLPLHAQPYQRIKDYSRYVQEWQKSGRVRVHNVSNLASIPDLCNSDHCHFYYYEYLEPTLTQPLYNRTVLMVAGMHGNQYLGPHVLLYGHQFFSGAHILYFPLANPSGFQLSQRLTHPQRVDPNRDFPIDGNVKCYQAYSTKVLDYIFRKHSIDLTLILHNGGNEIGFNWGTQKHITQSHTADYDIQISIAHMMNRVAGSNPTLGIQPFKVGTMNEVVYPAPGTFDDWAYAASKHPSLITQCKNHNFQPYPPNMTNGLVFLFEIGPHMAELLGSSQAVDIEEGSESAQDGYVSRAIRMLRAGLQVVHPWLKLKLAQRKAYLLVQGCQSAIVTTFQILQHINQTERLLYQLESPIEVEGSVRQDKPNAYMVELGNRLQNSSGNFSYRSTFSCSKEWLGKGTTFFATNRTYSFPANARPQTQNKHPTYTESTQPQIIQITQPTQTTQTTQSTQTTETTGATETESQVQQPAEWYLAPKFMKYGVMLVGLLGVLVLMSAIFAVLRCICAPKTPKNQERHEGSFEEEGEVETGQDLHTARGGIINQNL